jgi:hypothetical protein
MVVGAGFIRQLPWGPRTGLCRVPFRKREAVNDNDASRAEGIHLMIGRRPHAALGHSTGDRQMLEYTKVGDGARLGNRPASTKGGPHATNF